MLGSPPPYTPEPSLAFWKRIINLAKPALGIAVEELRPDDTYVQLILTAVSDIQLCENMFDGWMTRLNGVTTSSKKPDKQEQMLRFYLGLLREDAGHCSRATNAILQCHVQFADLMARRIGNASKSWFKGFKCDESETARLANDINQASRSLSLHVTHMKDHLTSFVSVLEKIGVTMRKERTLAGRILGWLKSLFKALVKIFVTLGTFILHSVAPGMSGTAPAASTLSRAAEAFCGAGSGPHEGKESESIDSVVLFLKEIVPKEAQTAQKRLERFDKALLVMGLEARMRTGRRVALRGPDPATVAKEWSDVAKRYQSVLPDASDEDPDY